jgi:23S rRNA (guanosine2251-2'-O)-methyltransferase
MKPPRSDRPRGAPTGAKPPHKSGRSQGAAGAGARPGAPDRNGDRSGAKPSYAPSYAGAADKPRFGGGDASRPRFNGGHGSKTHASTRPAGEPARFRPEREEVRPARAPQTDRTPHRAPARVQDRARESLTRERDMTVSPPAAPRSGGAPHAAEAPRGTVWLYGIHAVQAALENPARRLRRLVVTEEGSANLTARLPQPWALTPETVDRARIDQLLGRDAVHQGAALLADLLPQPVLATALERPGPVLVLDQVTDPRNIGAILRSAAAFGVAAVIVQERHAPEETGSLAKAASGALETVPLLRAVNLARTIVMLKAANFWVVGLDAEATGALDGAAFKDRRVALVLGGEGSGLRRLTRESCDELAKLPMAGIMESLNVSAATAVALYELGRQK